MNLFSYQGDALLLRLLFLELTTCNCSFEGRVHDPARRPKDGFPFRIMSCDVSDFGSVAWNQEVITWNCSSQRAAVLRSEIPISFISG